MPAGELSNYLRLLKLGTESLENTQALPELRLAVLGNHATQQYTKVLAATFLEQGYFAKIYEGEFNTIPFEVLDEHSGLHTFQPEIVYLSLCVQSYRERFYSSKPEERETLPETYVREIEELVEKLKLKGCLSVLNTLALPVERLFGNYSLLTNQSLYGSVCQANTLLVSLIKKQTGVYLNDVQYLASQIGGRQFFDEKLWTHSKFLCPNKYLPELATNVVNTVLATKGKVTKAIVVDLDNTLWGGIIGDDGLEGIAIGDTGVGEAHLQFQKYLAALKDRGYVLAVNSKNEEAAALSPFEQHPNMFLKRDDFSAFVANWNDKASNLEYIADTLNLGIDSFVFIDDSAFEREQVSSAHKSVKTPELSEEPAEYVRLLEQMHLFETVSFSEEDRKRALLYLEEAKRSQAKMSFGNIDDYLKSLEMQVTCSRFTPETLPRIEQLIQRSNQFNLRTQRYSKLECEKRMKDTDHFLSLSFSLKDKFGDYGLVGVVCADYLKDSLFVSELVMSCRVLKRGMEQFMMNLLVEEAKRKKLLYVKGEYIPTAKNKLVSAFYDHFGFEKELSDNGTIKYTLATSKYKPCPVFLKESSV